jgi:long-chain acyl-CoA synthetase
MTGRETPFALIDECLEKYDRRKAIVFLGFEITYGELKKFIDIFATSLADLGVKKNAKIIIYLPNTPQWIIAFLGAMKIGAVPVPISPLYTPTEVAYMSNDCGAEIIVCQDTNFGYVKEIMPKSTLKKIIYTNIADMLPWWKRAHGFLFDLVPRGKVKRDEGVWHFTDLLSNTPNPPQVEIDPREHLGFILYTGGTTGFPKGVPWTQAGFYYGGLLEWKEILKGSMVEEGKSRLIVQLPIFHILGLDIFCAFGLLMGNTSILIPQQ